MNALFAHLPPFFSEIAEIRAVFAAVGAELLRLRRELETIQADQSVLTATQTGLKRLADAMGIKNIYADAESLRFELRTALLEKRPYHAESIERMLKNLCGEDGYRLYIDSINQTVTVKLALSRQNHINSVADLLDRIVPANMAVYASQYNTYGVFHTANKTYGDLSNHTYSALRTEAVT